MKCYQDTTKNPGITICFFLKKSVKVSFSGVLDVSKVHQLNELGVMILFWILYRKVSLKYHRSVIGALMAFYRKSYGFSSKHQSVFLSKTTQIPLKFHRHVIMDKVFCISITSVFILLKFLLLFLHETCPLGASSVPHLSKQRSPIGQASCPFLCLFDLFFRKACRFIIILQLGISFRTFKLSSRTC